MPQQSDQKQWFPVLAPAYLDGQTLGDVRAKRPSDIQGRTINLNLSNVLGDKRKQNTEVTFEVVTTDSGKGHTETKRVGMTEQAVNRVVRRGRSRVDASFPLESRDGKTIRVKPFIITMTRVSNSVETALRHRAESILDDFLQDNDAASFFEAVINNTLQRQLKNELSEITPVRFFDLRESVVEA